MEADHRILTKNQKKKRRQKLGKLYKSDQKNPTNDKGHLHSLDQPAHSSQLQGSLSTRDQHPFQLQPNLHHHPFPLQQQVVGIDPLYSEPVILMDECGPPSSSVCRVDLTQVALLLQNRLASQGPTLAHLTTTTVEIRRDMLLQRHQIQNAPDLAMSEASFPNIYSSTHHQDESDVQSIVNQHQYFYSKESDGISEEALCHQYMSCATDTTSLKNSKPTTTAAMGSIISPVITKKNISKAKSSKNNRSSKVFLYGNYHRYYGYRPIDEDPRLTFFDRKWFSGKRCLDIGCNEGLLTLAMTTSFHPASMVGIDIDEQLVRKACVKLNSERSKAEARAAAARQRGVDSLERKSARSTLSSLTQTWFLHGDFTSDAYTQAPGSIDMVTAMSMTKWVHLHQGDDGLKAMFVKIFTVLSPGGLLLIEPQPWKSYQNASAKLRKEHAVPVGSYFDRIQELKLRPEAFPDYLCDELGFRLVKRMNISDSVRHGFDRPMYLFRKAS